MAKIRNDCDSGAWKSKASCCLLLNIYFFSPNQGSGASLSVFTTVLSSLLFFQERVFLTISNYIFTAIFVAEMTVKVKHYSFSPCCSLTILLTFFLLFFSAPPHQHLSFFILSVNFKFLLSYSIPPSPIWPSAVCPLYPFFNHLLLLISIQPRHLWFNQLHLHHY